MKTLKYMSLLALAAGITACSQYEEPNPQVPVTSQPEEFLPGTNGVSLTPSKYVAADEETGELKTINIVSYEDLGFDIPMANISLEEAELPSGYTLSYVMYAADNENYEGEITVPTTVKDGVIYVSPEALQAVHDTFVGAIVADDMELWVRYAVYASNSNVTNVRLGSADTWFAPTKFIITPQPAKIECLYTPGNSNGWNQSASQKLGTYQTNDKWTEFVDYQGFAYLDGPFKFTSALDWKGINFGAGDEPGVLSTDDGAGNLTSPITGLQYLSVNISTLTWKDPVEITSAGLIGTATPGGWDAQTNLTPSSNGLTWTGTVAMTGGEWKIRFNDNWDINLGGATDNLVFDGGNIMLDEGGTYNITLNLSTLPYTITLEK